MRLDKFLKVSRIIKRRTIAKDACDNGRVSINNKVSKAGSDIKVGDIIEIAFANKKIKAEILSVQETVKKDMAKEMYKILEGEEDVE